MARDPLEGIRPSDMNTRPSGRQTVSGGGTGRAKVTVTAALIGVIAAGIIAGFVLASSRPATPVGGTQVMTPAPVAPRPTAAPLTAPTASPTLRPPPPPAPSPESGTSHG